MNKSKYFTALYILGGTTCALLLWFHYWTSPQDRTLLARSKPRSPDSPVSVGSAGDPTDSTSSTHVDTHTPAAAGGLQTAGSKFQANSAHYTALLNRPELREMAARRITKDYAPLFSRLHLSPKIEELLSQILLDQLTALPGQHDQENYGKLVQQLLTPGEYEEYRHYRNELPLKYRADSALAALAPVAGNTRDDRKPIVDALVRATSLNDIPEWHAADQNASGGAQLGESELSALRRLATQRFEGALAQHANSLSETDRQLLRAWYKKNVIDFNLAGLRLLGEPAGS